MKRFFVIAGVIIVLVIAGGLIVVIPGRPQPPRIPGQPSEEELWARIAQEVVRTLEPEEEDMTTDPPVIQETDSHDAVPNNEERMLAHMLEQQDVMITFLNGGIFTRERIRAVFDDDDLPVLLAYLMDRRYRDTWRYLVYIVSDLGNPDLTVPVLIDFIIREDTYKNHEDLHLMAKAQALLLLGELGGEDAEQILRLAITEEGARDLGASWLDGQLPSPFNGERDFLVMMQSDAAFGLVLTGDADNIALVEARHAELLPEMPPLYSKLNQKIPLSNTEDDRVNLFTILAEVLIARDHIEEMGREAFEPLLNDPFIRMGATTDEHRRKYGMWIPDYAPTTLP